MVGTVIESYKVFIGHCKAAGGFYSLIKSRLHPSSFSQFSLFIFIHLYFCLHGTEAKSAFHRRGTTRYGS